MSIGEACLYFGLGALGAWTVREWRTIWRQRPPVVRGDDGRWRAQRGVGRGPAANTPEALRAARDNALRARRYPRGRGPRDNPQRPV